MTKLGARIRWAAAMATACAAAACSSSGKPDDTARKHPPKPGDARPAAPQTAAPRAPRQVANTTPNTFIARGAPTFVVGTRGDDIADQRIAVQVQLVRGLALPRSRAVSDTTIDVTKGPSAWPRNALVYGGEDDNAVIAGLATSLPYRVTRKRIAIGGQVFQGEGYRLIAVTPASENHPEFVLFAGTGEGGMAEINGGIATNTPIVIADRFGTLVHGTWSRTDGKLVAKLGPRRRRIEYRTVRRSLAAATGTNQSSVSFLFPAMLDKANNEGELIDACMRGLTTVVKKLGLAAPVDMSIYLYPDRRSKRSLTGNAGDGHAVPSSRALHMYAPTAAAAQQLVAHEATHVLAYYGYGPAGSALMGEGVAVWVSGGYRGRSIAAWKSQMQYIPIATLLGSGWRNIPEQNKYPVAGLVVQVAVANLGRDKALRHLLGASVHNWDAACAKAGTTPAKLEARVRAAQRRP